MKSQRAAAFKAQPEPKKRKQEPEKTNSLQVKFEEILDMFRRIKAREAKLTKRQLESVVKILEQTLPILLLRNLSENTQDRLLFAYNDLYLFMTSNEFAPSQYTEIKKELLMVHQSEVDEYLEQFCPTLDTLFKRTIPKVNVSKGFKSGGSSTTLNELQIDPDRSIILEHWTDFNHGVLGFIADTSNVMLKRPLPSHSQNFRVCHNESEVGTESDTHIFDPLSRVIPSIPGLFKNTKGFAKFSFVPPNGNTKNHGLPDRVAGREGAENAAATVEIKAPWVLTVKGGDLVKAFSTDKGKGTTVQRAVEQECFYMELNWHKYGVLTTGDQTWFIKREDGKFLISPCVRCDQKKPYNIFAAWLYFFSQIDASSCIYGSPGKAVQKGVDRKLFDQRRKAQPNIYESKSCLNLRALCRASNNLGHGYTGTVVRGEFAGSTGPAVLKIFDLYYRKLDKSVIADRTNLAAEKQTMLHLFEREVAFYEKMKDLQGTVIPKFVACGSYGRGIRIIITEYCGRTITKQEYKKYKNEIDSCLKMIHDLNLKHNDLRLPNILIDETKPIGQQIRIIDFGFMVACDSGEEIVENVRIN